MATSSILKLFTRSLLLLAACLFLTACSSQKTIVHRLDEREANDIIVYLAKKGIEAVKVKNTDSSGGGGNAIVLWDINVDAIKGIDAMAALSEGGFPRRPGQTLLTIFPKSGLVPSEMEEKIRYQAGLAEQIAGTIRKIDGVLDADVQLSIPEEDPLNPNAKKENVSASVYVKHTGVLDDPNSQLIPKIKRFVASSVQGLNYDNVTVIPDRARFAESPFTTATITSPKEEQEYVSIWGIVIARESVFFFQTLFFIFCFLLLLLLLGLSWLVWKFFPVMHTLGGIKSLFSVHPLHPESLEKAMKEREESSKAEDKKKADEKKEEPKKDQETPPNDGEAT